MRSTNNHLSDEGPTCRVQSLHRQQRQGETDWNQIFHRMRKGDREAWGRVYSTFRTPVLTFLQRKGFSDTHAEDAYQDLLVKLRTWESPVEFSSEKALAAWMCVAVRNIVINTLRKEKHRRSIMETMRGLTKQRLRMDAEREREEDWSVQMELTKEALPSVVGDLSPEEQFFFDHVLRRGVLTQGSYARRIGKDEGTVSRWKNRLLGKIRSSLLVLGIGESDYLESA